MASIFSTKEEKGSSARLEPLKRIEKGSSNPCEEQNKEIITETVKVLGSFEGPLVVCELHEILVEQICPVVLQSYDWQHSGKGEKFSEESKPVLKARLLIPDY